MLIINGNITINGNVNINDKSNKISKAKDDLLNVLYHKRNCADWGAREGWTQMLDWYFVGAYELLSEHISEFKNSISKAKALSCLNIIIADNSFSWQKQTTQN